MDSLERSRRIAYVTCFIILADQVTKILVRRFIPLHDSVPVIRGFFNLVHLQNPGAAFNFLSEVDSPWVGRGFILLSLVAIGFIVWMYSQADNRNWLMKNALILILGGAAGNLIDRISIGTVTDFLDFYLQNHHWPAFNVADSCISIGAILFVISIALFEKKETDFPS